MVNMANLPQGKEFSWKGGVKSIARGKERSSDPALSLAAQILISRGYNGLGSSVSHEADAHKNICLLYTSDAADEEDSGALGGCRILKKKKKTKRKNGD